MKSYDTAALLRLFRMVPHPFAVPAVRSVLDCLDRGFAVVRDGRPIPVPGYVFTACAEVYGIDGTKLNQTFHKSFQTVAELPPEEYYAQQIAHYLTTYGAEALGVRMPAYIPAEALKVPDGPIPFEKLNVIRAADEEDIRAAIDGYALRTVSPGEKQLALFQPLLPFVRVETERIACFELQCRKHALDGTVPEHPVSLLRYLVYETTGETLLIKSDDLIRKIAGAAHDADKVRAASVILCHADPVRLSSIFLRYKPIFLAFRTFDDCRPVVNRLRRLAVRHHRPLSSETLQNAVNLALSGDRRAFLRLAEAASNRELVKLCNAVSVRQRAAEPTPGVYAVRNGKTWVREDAVRARSSLSVEECLTLAWMREELLRMLAGRLSRLKGRVFHIPAYADYAAPHTERQLVGAFPYGTRIKTPENTAFTAGIHWFNQKGTRVDLDLHLNSTGGHFGWNGAYKSIDTPIIFTGDMTDAPEPDGAAEAYYFDPANDVFTLSVNRFSGPEDTAFRFFLTHDVPKTGTDSEEKQHYTFDPSRAVFAPIPLTLAGEREANLGVFLDGAFVFYGGRLGDARIPTAEYGPFLRGVAHLLRSRLMLRELLAAAGATVVDDPEHLPDGVAAEDVTDLTPEALTPETLLRLIDGEED